ncbi:MAG: alpha/beta hydrolase [Planctomycetaceae bacterium]|nr:alpha/beta hydrolase [Planctomycetaceae bacterium]
MLVLYLLVPYLCVTLIFAIFQRQLIYRGTRSNRLDVSLASFAGSDSQNVALTVDDDVIIRGWLLKTKTKMTTRASPAHTQPVTDAAPPRRLVIYFAGNAQHRQDRATDLHQFLAAGVDVLACDYRGFGDSDGTPTEANLTHDAAAIWDFAISEGYLPSQIIVYGESLGGAAALSLWSAPRRPEPAAVILNSTFSSMQDVAATLYPWFPFQYLVVDRWASLERIGRVTCPVYIFHGTDDQIVPISLGRKLAAAGRLIQFIEVPGGRHNELPAGRLRSLLQQPQQLSAPDRIF